jgi:hypothetical protein
LGGKKESQSLPKERHQPFWDLVTGQRPRETLKEEEEVAENYLALTEKRGTEETEGENESIGGRGEDKKWEGKDTTGLEGRRRKPSGEGAGQDAPLRLLL